MRSPLFRVCRPFISQQIPLLSHAIGMGMAVLEIRIELKKGVADPEGKNTKKTLESLGFKGLGEVKTVKLFEMEVDLPADEAKKAGEEMCRKLLANPVIQNYKVTVR